MMERPWETHNNPEKKVPHLSCDIGDGGEWRGRVVNTSWGNYTPRNPSAGASGAGESSAVRGVGGWGSGEVAWEPLVSEGSPPPHRRPGGGPGVPLAPTRCVSKQPRSGDRAVSRPVWFPTGY